MTLQRYLTRLIWITILPVLALAAGLSYFQFAQERDRDGLRAKSLATTVAREIDNLLRARMAALQVLSLSPLGQNSRWPELHREAQGFHTSFGNHVALIDARNRPQWHTKIRLGDPLPPITNETVQRVVQAALSQAVPQVGDAYVGQVTRERSIPVAVPARGDGEPAFVLLGVLPVAEFEGLLDGVPLPALWRLAIRDGRGEIVAQRGGVLPASAASGAVIRVAERPTAAPWLVQVQVPRVTYVQHLAEVGGLLGVALLGVTLVSVLAGRWGTRRLARSMRALATLAPTPVRPDEIDEVREARRLLDDALAQREASESALRLREEQLRRIFESASEAIITADEQQRIVLANPAAARIFGRRLDEVIGAPLAGLMPERFRARHQDDVESFGRSDSGPRSMGRRPDVAGLRADGTEFPIEAAISQVCVDGQRLYTVILRDVSERRQAEAAVAAAKARLEATIESMTDALAMVDTDQRIVEMNAAFARMYGFASKAECPRDLREYEHFLEVTTLDGDPVPPEQWSKSRALRGESGSGVERRLRRRDTGLAWIASFSFAPILDPNGCLLGAVVTVRDVTERRRMEDELRTSHADLARLVTAQQTVEEKERKRIARELHDELQQVLAAIKMDVGSIESELAANPKHVPALLTRIDDLATAAITSSRRIVNDLRPLLLEELGLVPALEALARGFAERTGIGVELEADASSRTQGMAPDAIAICLYRVAQEALNNAAKHARARRVRITLSVPDGGGWRLVVSDDGRGMDPEDRRKPMSFGLRGMAERVRALGGTLIVNGEGGRGVTLEVEIGTAQGGRVANP